MIKNFQNTSPTIPKSAFIAENAVVIGDVEIGEQASVWYNCVLRGDVNYIRIGDRTNLQDLTMIHVSSRDFPTVVEHDVVVGHCVTLHGCYVETGSLIGIGSVILDGARIGKDSLIAAGSLITPGTEIPEGSFALGRPARVKREVTSEEIAEQRRICEGYVELASIYSED
ncbi:MAG: gamma carbonic anhydrase family protein [Acidobacteria bacterium]|nr:MAG: gamma carbonic anhydrase family protein [Acidobacteriota bacterium]REK04163.1 MAG: gamma carbonic anhydrase family protein [Acidobacteriota bacterium]REK15325.1 MAG: gamma carbonic anhydrase family protein [Acidobacteriota bacterium]REK46415.1 MAG: gamma carbonic anhydrase family protein [Acidobacteriota bacterium]